MHCVTEREHSFLRARLFFVTAATTKGGIELVFVQRLLQAFGLHDRGVLATGNKRIQVQRSAFLVDVADDFQAQFLFRVLVTELVHVLELPSRIDMHQWKRRLGRVEGLHRQMHHHRRVLTDRVQHDRVFELGCHFPDDVDALSFKLL